MTSPEPIGGFFELELARDPERSRFPHEGALHLNSGRSCLEYVIRASGVQHIHIPKYTCDAVLEPIHRTGISHSFYSIDAELKPTALPQLSDGEYFLYTNYFGCTDGCSRDLGGLYGSRLILDCSQALFFDPPAGAHAFYSPRKFVGVPDGGCLYTDAKLAEPLENDVSLGRYAHLVGRIDRGPEAVYADFKRADDNLSGDGMKWMSPSTRRLLGTIDFPAVREIRRRNFEQLHAYLDGGNGLSFGPDQAAAPMIYPFLTEDPGLRARLIDNKVFVATYWPNVLQWCAPDEWEHQLTARLLPLPIDQRYGPAEMERIVKLVLGR
jgi:hypothetical protein